MKTEQLFNANKGQQKEIARGSQHTDKDQQIDYEGKYKKALKDISGVIRANRQLKQELDKVKANRQNDVQSNIEIQRDELQKAYEKVLKEKNELFIINQNLQFEKQKLKYSVQSLEEYVAQLKSQQMSLAREKQALERNSTINRKGLGTDRSDKNYDDGKQQIALLKQKQIEYHRTIENYEEHHANLNRSNRQLEQSLQELQNRFNKSDLMWRGVLEKKQVEVHEARAQIRKEYIDQIANLKKECSNLRSKLSEALMKIQAMEINQISIQQATSEKKYETQLIDTLRELSSQMEPMKSQINELQDTNMLEKEQGMRERANLKMKVIDLQSSLQQMSDNCKVLQQKLILMNQKERNYEEQNKFIQKLEEENRMLGGRVIVLESKDVALKNRSGEELEEKILQFQTRVELLLNGKENLSNLKNVSIHQMIALKAYIMELDAKLRSLMSQNQYSVKKYKTYKEKYQNIVKQLKNNEVAINGYKNKIHGYDKLVLKLQGQLEKTLNIYDLEINSEASKITQQESNTSIQIYRRRYIALQQKLQLQQKYSKQELQTTILNYQTKLMEMGIKVQQWKKNNQTLELYKLKNQEICKKLQNKQNQILELKFQIGREKYHQQEEDTTTLNSLKQSRELIQTLHLTISDKETANIRLQAQVRRIQEDWSRKYSNLQKQYNNYKEDSQRPTSSQNRAFQAKIYELEQEIRKYKLKAQDLEFQLYSKNMKSVPKVDDVKIQQLMTKISNLELDYSEVSGKLQTFQASKRRLQQQLKQLQQQNDKLERSLIQQQNESRVKIQEFMSSLNKRDDQIRAQSYELNSSLSELKRRLAQQENINHRKSLQIQNLMKEMKYNQDNYQKSMEKYTSLVIKFDDVQSQLNNANSQKERLQTNSSRLEWKKKQIEEELRERESAMSKINGEQYSLKAQLDSIANFQRRINILEGEGDEKDRIINRLNLEVSRLNQENTIIYEKDAQISQLRNELNRRQATAASQLEDLNVQTHQLVQEMYTLKTTINSLNINLGSKEEEIEDYKIQISRISDEVTQQRQRNTQCQHQIMDLQNKIKRMTTQNNRVRQAYDEGIVILNEKDNNIIKLTNQNRQYQFLKVQYEQMKTLAQHREQLLSKANSDIRLLQMQFENADIQEKQRWIVKLKNEIASIRMEYGNAINQLQDKLMGKEQLINKLGYELSMDRQTLMQKGDRVGILQQEIWKFKQQYSVLQEECTNQERSLIDKERQIQRFSSQLKQNQQQYHQLEDQLQQIQFNFTMASNELQTYRNNSQENVTIISEKEQFINKLNQEISYLKQNIISLGSQIQQRDRVISRQNVQLSQFRFQTTSYLDHVSAKESSLTNLNYQMNALRNKINQLQQQITQKDYNSSKIMQELNKVQNSLTASENQIQAKISIINRMKNDTTRMQSEIQELNSSISFKNNQINKLSQQMHKRTYEQANNSSFETMRLQQELTSLKYKVTTLQSEVDFKEETIAKLRLQLKLSQRGPENTIYSQDDFNRLREEAYRVQRQLTNAKNQIADKDFFIGQMEGKINFQEKSFSQQKRNYQQQINKLQRDIQQLIQNEHRLIHQLNEHQQVNYQTNETDANYKNVIALQQYEMQQLKDQLTRISQINHLLEQKNQELVLSAQAQSERQRERQREIQIQRQRQRERQRQIQRQRQLQIQRQREIVKEITSQRQHTFQGEMNVSESREVLTNSQNQKHQIEVVSQPVMDTRPIVISSSPQYAETRPVVVSSSPQYIETRPVVISSSPQYINQQVEIHSAPPQNLPHGQFENQKKVVITSQMAAQGFKASVVHSDEFNKVKMVTSNVGSSSSNQGQPKVVSGFPASNQIIFNIQSPTHQLNRSHHQVIHQQRYPQPNFPIQHQSQIITTEIVRQLSPQEQAFMNPGANTIKIIPNIPSRVRTMSRNP